MSNVLSTGKTIRKHPGTSKVEELLDQATRIRLKRAFPSAFRA